MTTRSVAAATGLLLICFGGGASSDAQSPPKAPPGVGQPRDANTKKSGTARLSGRVTALETGAPVRRAIIGAIGAAVPEGKSVSTDAEGRWELTGLPAGRLTVNVTRNGFLTLEYGQRRPFQPGKSIELSDGQSISNVDFALPRASAVTGRVLDEFGEPVSGVRVSSMRYRFSEGQLRLATVGAASVTDDIGQYRLHGLPPGDYYIVATPPSLGVLSSSADRVGYGVAFYPDTLSAAAASRLTLAIGQESTNVDVSLSPVRFSSISGTSRDSNGKALTQGAVFLRPADGAGMAPTAATFRPDGTWALSGIVPGIYDLTVQIGSSPSLEGAAAGQVVMEFARQRITVSGENITGLELVTSRGATATGEVRFDGPGPETFPSGMAITAHDPTPSGVSSTVVGAVTPQGTFGINGLFDRRVLRVSGTPRGWTLKSITRDGTDITDSGIVAAPDQKISGLTVTLSQQVTEVTGTVQTSKGEAAADYVVVVFATDPARWGARSRFVDVARPDQTGRFALQGLPAGSYHAVALEYLEQGQHQDAALLDRLKSLSVNLRLEDGEKKAVQLRLSSQ